MRLNMTLSPKIIRNILITIAILLASISLITEYVALFVLTQSNNGILLDALDLWSVNLEESIPTWYSVILLFSVVVCLIVIAKGKSSAKDHYALHWWGLVFLFAYLSMDEGAVIHEIFATPLQTAFNTGGFLAFGWQILYVPLVIIFGITYLRFLFHLPQPTRNGFMLSAVLYAGGALIIEGISASQYDENNLTMLYLSIATVEEFLEILGVSLFIYTLLTYIQDLEYSVLINTETTKAVDNPQILEKPKAGYSSISLNWNPLMVGMMFLVMTNIVSLGWILSQVSQNNTVLEAITFYEPHLQNLEDDGVIIMEVPDIFGLEDNHSLDIAHALASEYDAIYIVALPSHNDSVIFAGDTLPFDRHTLTEWLHAQGIIEFIIFDSASVNAILGN